MFFPADAKLFAPQFGGDFLHRAFGQLAELEGAIGHADQAGDFQAQAFHHPLDLAVLAFLQAHRDPGINPLATLDVRDDGTIGDTGDGDAGGQLVEIGLVDLAE